jgi:hypothetical protein
MKYRPMPPLEELKEFLDYNPDTGIFTWIKKSSIPVKVGQVAGRANGNGYVRIKFKGRDYFAHRLAYYMYHGVDPLEKCIDHIDGDKANNKIDNLRLASVSWHKSSKKWRAYIMINGESKHLGLFTNKEDAIKARREAKIKYIGDFRGNL